MRNLQEKIITTLFIVCLALGLYRIWGYTIYEVPYGYDPGFFRYAIQSAIDTLPSLPYHEPLFALMSLVLVFI